MNDLIYGKIPPQAINIEESILGILLTQPNAMVQVSDILKPEMFYKDANILIYTVIDELHIKSYPIDIMTVSQELRNKGKLEEAGGVFYISELTNSEYGNIVYNSKIIVQKWMQREMIRISHETIKEAYEDITDVFDLIDKTSLQIVSISNRKQNNIKTVGYIKTKISKSILSGQPISECFSLGISGLDFMSKTFNVVAGYQGTGKTALMLTACKNLAKNKVKSGSVKVNGGLDKTGKGKDRIVERKPFGKRNNIWRFDTQKNSDHPAPFPEQLANDHIISWSNENDLIYDPFMGSGTTAKMAILNNRKYIGSEISEDYCKIIETRIKECGGLFFNSFQTELSNEAGP